MNITPATESAEYQYKQILEDFFISSYNEKSLSSHGIEHHRRVWRYSKELLNLIPLKNTAQISHLASELIIACYLHDIGMSVDPGVKHGVHSRDLCVRFLTDNGLPQNKWKSVLDAIENHDNKDYSGNVSGNQLLTILSVADDLDAFGYIGIFRYIEIYLTRNTNPEKIGFRIRENAEKRFVNFSNVFGLESEIVRNHTRRYNILDNFFRKYNEQLPSYHFGTLNPYGYCGVVEIFLYLATNNLQINDFYSESDKYSTDSVVMQFFAELEKELSFFEIH